MMPLWHRNALNSGVLVVHTDTISPISSGAHGERREPRTAVRGGVYRHHAYLI
jgi:hypothetical protein